MLNYNDKPLEELDFNECMEFEKSLLKKIMGASRAGMNDNLIDQLNFFLGLVRQRKSEALQKEIDDIKKDNDKNDDGVTIDTGLDE